MLLKPLVNLSLFFFLKKTTTTKNYKNGSPFINKHKHYRYLDNGTFIARRRQQMSPSRQFLRLSLLSSPVTGLNTYPPDLVLQESEVNTFYWEDFERMEYSGSGCTV